MLAGKCNHVTGIDLDESMISFAEKIKPDNTRFLVADARDLNIFEDNQFDVVTMSLAYHQFKSEDRQVILNEATRIGKKIIISDYTFPTRTRMKRVAVYTIERIAGKEHFNNFRSYMQEKGLANVSEISQLRLVHKELSGSGVFMLGVFIN
jgi:demethylmenaquinone methyltransferase/2-methoxy-6-polyprenyl-1,4-benzoquinol methylase